MEEIEISLKQKEILKEIEINELKILKNNISLVAIILSTYEDDKAIEILLIIKESLTKNTKENENRI